ncbi:MAG: hypothetical protein M3552_00980 [Planctomycetota bacterium]|nr:hypothetical protein [Planctomycetota bacterium]
MPTQSVRRFAGAIAASAAALVAAAIVLPVAAAEGDQTPVPQWLWTSKSAKSNEKAIFRTTFDVKEGLKSASLSVSCDNIVRVQLNDADVGQHTTWEEPLREEVTAKIKPGENAVTLRCTNADGAAGALFQLTLRYADGSRQDIVSDGSWKAAETPRGPWNEPVVLGALGVQPWGKLPFGDALAAPEATPIDEITVPQGFTIDRLYSVPKGTEGSWVSLTADNKGRLIACDQYGGLFRVVPGAPGHEDQTIVEPIDVPIGDAQGLLYAFDSLYVVVNGEAAQGSGLYRVRDTDNDDKFDKVELLKKLKGGGEHGPHAIRLGPDGNLWIIAGNHTDPPELRILRNGTTTKTICCSATRTATVTPPAVWLPAAGSRRPTRTARNGRCTARVFAIRMTSRSTKTARSSPTTPTWNGTRACPGIGRPA